MNLKELAKAAATVQTNHAILIYSRPKFGKTRLAGTAAKIPEIKKIYWFDGENGFETLLHMGLTDEEMEKITIFKMSDTRENPVFIETMLKAFSKNSSVDICDLHGKVGCVECKKAGSPSNTFSLNACTHNDLVIIDSGSQLGDSALAATMLGKDAMAKPGWDEYGVQVKWLGDIFSVIQQARNTNFVVLTHELVIEEDINDVKKDVIYPLVGTKNFCMKVAKYFGTVVYMYKKIGKHAAASMSTFRGDVITGSRVGAQMEKLAEPDLRAILVDGGIIREGVAGSSTVVAPSVATSATVAPSPPSPPVAPATLTAAERLKLIRKSS